MVPDESQWGQAGVAGAAAAGAGKGGKAVNLYAEHLSGTEGAVLSRSSNLYGMLTTDDPFQYLGGIALAVRHLDGKAPELYISNLRGSGSGRVEGAAQFLAKELATRQFHPGYIQGLMKEGYAGTAAGAGRHQQLLGLDGHRARDRARRPVAGDGRCLRARQAPAGPERLVRDERTPTPWPRPWSACWRPRARATGRPTPPPCASSRSAGATWPSASTCAPTTPAFQRYVGAGQGAAGYGLAAGTPGAAAAAAPAPGAQAAEPPPQADPSPVPPRRPSAACGWSRCTEQAPRQRRPRMAGAVGGAGAGRRHAGRWLVAAQGKGFKQIGLWRLMHKR
ncbi:cobaltochelatase [Alicycliphilus sp. B1]|nr:cobaltochelatase [Alicycliphilus sp. B1]